MAAAETARLIASLELQDKNFTRGLSRVEKGIGRVDKRLGAFSGFLNRNMSRALDSIAARGVDALGDAIQAGSDLNEEITKSEAVFGSASKEIIAFSETTSAALGLSQKDALAAAGNFGNMFKTIGLAEGASEDMSERLVTLAADMASFNNEDPAEMLDKLRSGLAGEAEPLRRFGVLLSEAAVKEEAYASGIAKSGDKLTEAQKVQARYNLILKQTAVQQGDVAKTGGNLAGQQRKLNAMLADASATIGTALLPAVTDVTSEFVKLFQDPATKKGLQAFAKDLGEGAKDLVKSLKGVDWKGFAGALGTAAGFAKDLVTAFLSLPPWVQTAVVTGWGLNKLTGGGVTSLLGKALGKGFDMFSGRGGSPASPVFTKEVGLGGGGGGMGGKGGRFGRFGGAVALGAGAVAVIGFERAITIWEETNQRSTEQANTAQQSLNNMLSQDAKLGDMLTAQRAVKDGIKDIRSNPLLTLVQGEALDRLNSMDAQLTKAIEERARPIINERAPINAALNQGSIATREGGGRTTAAELKAIQAKVQSSTTAIKNAQSIASRENSEQKGELGNIKNNITTQTNAQKTAAVAAAATTVLQGSLQAARDSLARITTSQAGIKAANASRAAGTTVSSAISVQTGILSRAIWASAAAYQPVIQSTNVVNNYTSSERGGASADSRTRRAD